MYLLIELQYVVRRLYNFILRLLTFRFFSLVVAFYQTGNRQKKGALLETSLFNQRWNKTEKEIIHEVKKKNFWIS